MNQLTAILNFFLTILPGLIVQFIILGSLIAIGIWVYRDSKKNQAKFPGFWATACVVSCIPFLILYLIKRQYDITDGPTSRGSRFIFGLACFFVFIPIAVIGATIYFITRVNLPGSIDQKLASLQKDKVVFEYYTDNNQRSIRVAEVDPNGFAHQLNLAKGDVLKMIDNEIIDTMDKAYVILPEFRGPFSHNVTIERNGKTYNISLPKGTALIAGSEARQVINYFDKGQLYTCQEYENLSDQELSYLVKNCNSDTSTCKISSEKRCSEQNAILDCQRGRVEHKQSPLRAVFYTKSGMLWPAAFIKSQCDRKNNFDQTPSVHKTNCESVQFPFSENAAMTASLLPDFIQCKLKFVKAEFNLKMNSVDLDRLLGVWTTDNSVKDGDNKPPTHFVFTLTKQAGDYYFTDGLVPMKIVNYGTHFSVSGPSRESIYFLLTVDNRIVFPGPPRALVQKLSGPVPTDKKGIAALHEQMGVGLATSVGGEPKISLLVNAVDSSSKQKTGVCTTVYFQRSGQIGGSESRGVNLNDCMASLKTETKLCGQKISMTDPMSRVISIQQNFGDSGNYQKEPGTGFTVVGTIQCP